MSKSLSPAQSVTSTPNSFGLGHELRQRWLTADFIVPARADWPSALRRVRLIGGVLCVVLAAAFIGWNVVEYNRFSLAFDFASRLQMAHLVANGQLNPYSTLFGYAYLQDHGEFEMIVIGEIYRLWPHPLMLLWLQDLMVAAGCWFAFDWVCVMAARHHARGGSARIAVCFAALGALMLLSTPWTWWTISADVHFESAWGALFALLTVRDFVFERRRAWLWALCTVATGDVGSTYLVLIGLGLMLYGRRWCKPGLGLVTVGIGWGLMLGAAGFSQAIAKSGFDAAFGAGHAPKSTFAVIEGMVKHPEGVLKVLRYTRTNTRTDLLSNGLIGVFWPPVMLLTFGVVFEGAISAGIAFSDPGFQNLIVTLVMPVGTIAVLSRLANGRLLGTERRIIALVAVLAVNAAGWAIVWLPQLGPTWLANTPAAASTLNRVLTQVKPDDEVIMTQGVIGRFGARKSVFPIVNASASYPVRAKRVWLIVTPQNTTATVPALQAETSMTRFAESHAVKLVAHQNGVWAFLWQPPVGTHALNLDGTAKTVGAWAIPGAAGRAVFSGNASSWHVRSTTRAGAIVDSARWQPLGPNFNTHWTLWSGAYRATIQTQGGGGAEFQVWDRTEHQLLAQRSLPASLTRTRHSVDFTVTGLATPDYFAGPSLWQMQVQPAVAGDAIAIRVMIGAQRRTVSVYDIAIEPRSDG